MANLLRSASANILKSANAAMKITTRNIGNNKSKYDWKGEGIQYFGFKYYPRHPDFKDPPYTPTKLFRVKRIKPVKGTPYWERNILKQFKLDGKESDVVIIKNIPENNHRLWKIKHLVQIKPITFPNGFPKSTTGTYLKENGELVVKQHLNPVPERLQLTAAFTEDPKKMDGDTLRRDSRLKWLSGWKT